jgi:predicted GNAT superfamily acetyltransferase
MSRSSGSAPESGYNRPKTKKDTPLEGGLSPRYVRLMPEPTTAPAAPAAPRSAESVDIRPLRTQEELLACVELQRATWGDDFSDVVPASILKVSQRVGGVAAGAFDAEGRLLGFVFGLTGIEGGRVVHWSDMLAVRADARDLGLGHQLKEYQREVVRTLGGTVIYWTYDPLVARNAHLNFNKLGVRVTEYVEDMYGETDSELHRGLGTDRFVVAWPVARHESESLAAESRQIASDTTGARDAPVLNPDRADGSVPDLASFEQTRPRYVRVVVPRDIIAVRSRSPELAHRWRLSTRRAFQWAIARRYVVRGVYADEDSDSSWYVLASDSSRTGER